MEIKELSLDPWEDHLKCCTKRERERKREREKEREREREN